MKSILNEQSRQSEFTPGGIHGLYGTSWGAGMYGAFYSPRAQKLHGGDHMKSRTEAELEQIHDVIGEVKDNLVQTMKTMTNRIFKIDDKFGEMYAKGRGGTLSEDGRKDVLDKIKEKPSYMTKMDVFTTSMSKTWQDTIKAWQNPGRFMSDMLLGKPGAGIMRGFGRRYEV
jgi:hypothetical protein